MATNKRRNKKYRPRVAYAIGGLSLIASINRAKQRAKPLPGVEITEICTAYSQAVIAMTQGYAETHHLDTIVYALNVGAILAETQPELGGEYIEMLRAALEGMQRTLDRYLRNGKIGFDGEARIAVDAVYDLHEAQMKVATQRELAWAIDEMHRRIREQKAA